MKEKTTVLVVDDDPRMVKTICDILAVKGFDALQAHSGEEAVARVRSDGPDCVLMDIKLKGMSGVDALRMIKDILPDLPVILMSAYATEEQTAEAKAQGAYTVLNKPLDIEIVLSFLSLLRKEESILIVDDDPLFCKTLKDILQARGFRVETEAEPEKVLGHMENEYKLAMVLDLKLVEKDGLDVLREIRGKYPTKPVVLVTGYRDVMSSSIEKGLKIGAYACLYKPFEAEALIRSLEEIRRMKLQSLLNGTVPVKGR